MTARTLNRLRQIQVEQARPCARIKALMRFAKERPAESLAHKVAKVIDRKSVTRDNISDQRPHKGAAPIAHAVIERKSRNIVV